MCFDRNFCGWDGGWDGSYNAHLLTGRTNGGTHYEGSDGRVYMAPGEMGQRDILAHEFGHHMDFTYADDRISDTAEADEVEEALADMFSYDLDRTDAILGSPGRINWANPEAIKNPKENLPYPSTTYDGPGGRRDYKCGATDEHYNGTILSHAYYRFVTKVGHDVAGNVLVVHPLVPVGPPAVHRRPARVRHPGRRAARRVRQDRRAAGLPGGRDPQPGPPRLLGARGGGGTRP